MARPLTATVVDTTSSGVPFQWLVDGYKAKGARDANMEVIHVLVAWDDADAFLRDAVGYTTWSGLTGTPLQRVIPLQCPFRPGLYCESYDLVDVGAYESRDSFYDEFNYCFEQDWLIYQLVFTRPAYRVFADASLINLFAGKEQNRYCTYGRRYVPRERRKSGAAFQYLKAGGDSAVDADWLTIPDEAAFIPDYQIEYVIGWMQVPVNAVPELAVADQLLTVNNANFPITTHGGTRVWNPGTLLFKGTQAGIEAYQGADGGWYEDLLYVFAYQPGGWNSWLRPDLVGGARDYGPIRRRGGAMDPPYPGSDFDNLFVPGNT